MKLYSRIYIDGVMPGRFRYLRNRLVPCAPRPVTAERVSSNIDSVINERAGLTMDRVEHDAFGIVERKFGNRYWAYRSYGSDN